LRLPVAVLPIRAGKRECFHMLRSFASVCTTHREK
jgi:hypothetical protein